MSIVAHTFQILGQAARKVADNSFAMLGMSKGSQHSYNSADTSNQTRSAELKSLHQAQEPYSFLYAF